MPNKQNNVNPDFSTSQTPFLSLVVKSVLSERSLYATPIVLNDYSAIFTIAVSISSFISPCKG